jgi:hypothetical protein
MIPPTIKMQHAIMIVPRRPSGSVKLAKNAPTKQPPVNKATTVPERVSASFCKKRVLKESDAMTSAITPKS